MKVALISGITGQDGAYLASFLVDKGYKVIGMAPRRSNDSLERLRDLGVLDKIQIVTKDITDAYAVLETIDFYQPTEIYNLAAQSFVGASFECPTSTMTVNTLGTLNMLEAVKKVSKSRGIQIKFYQASTSEMFGNSDEYFQNEKTRFYPRSPYGVSKLAAHWLTINYRESHNLFACCGILFNHESPFRGLEFVTRKVTDAAARIYLGKQDQLFLGNLDASRDWGFAGDFVEAMWMMLQHDTPDDYVVATGESHTIKELLETTFGYLNLNYRDYVQQDPKYYRPAELNSLRGDPKKIKNTLGWVPKTSFRDMIHSMVDKDIIRNSD